MIWISLSKRSLLLLPQLRPHGFASGRFAMIDDGLGFQLVPWRPAIEQNLGKQVSGVMLLGMGVDWEFGRRRGLGL